MNNKRPSFLNLKCNAAKRAKKFPVSSLQSFSFQFPVSSFQLQEGVVKRKPLNWLLVTSPRLRYWLLVTGYWLLVLGCTLPKGEIAPENTQAKTPIEVVLSNRERKSPPPIFGIRHIETIGRTGNGAGEFRTPLGLTLDEEGRIYIADAGNNRVQVVDDAGNYIIEFGSRGWQTGEFDHPTDIALSFQRRYRLYVADTGNNRVQYCNFVDRIFYPLSASADDVLLDRPEGIGIGRNGEVYVVDTGNHRWIEFNVAGVPVVARGSFGSGSEQLWNPTDLAVDSHGNVYIVDTGNHLIKKYDFSGNPIDMWGGEGDALGQLREPKCISLDEWNYLYVTDSGNRRIQVFAPDGRSITEFSAPGLQEPAGIAISKTGRVFVSDAEANDIKVFQVFRKK